MDADPDTEWLVRSGGAAGAVLRPEALTALLASVSALLDTIELGGSGQFAGERASVQCSRY
jgi:hypothetical protein